MGRNDQEAQAVPASPKRKRILLSCGRPASSSIERERDRRLLVRMLLLEKGLRFLIVLFILWKRILFASILQSAAIAGFNHEKILYQ